MSAGVYRVFDAADRLLYVGCSVDVPTRLTTHEQNAPWWVYMARFEVTDYPDRDSAAEAEATAISTEHPRWNISGRSPEHPDGAATSMRQAPWLQYEAEIASKVRSLRSERVRLEQRLDRVEVELQGAEALVGLISRQELEDPSSARDRKRAALRDLSSAAS
jgi:excinuclease UvrABC nuclease subunit